MALSRRAKYVLGLCIVLLVIVAVALPLVIIEIMGRDEGGKDVDGGGGANLETVKNNLERIRSKVYYNLV